jgi:predicted Rossmann fold flavoprotein
MNIVVIGGGAAGFFGAIACAESAPHARVHILERNAQVLAKVRISGGGRCNVTHACFDPAALTGFYPRGGAALRGPFTRFGPADAIAWFESRGIPLKTERDGRVFPVSDSSADVVDCLTRSAERAGVALRTHARIDDLRSSADGFTLHMKDGEIMHADRVLLATGSAGRAWQWAAALGHAVVPPAPSIFTFAVDDPRIADLAGVACPDARVTLRSPAPPRAHGLTQRGPLLVTHWGFSGPAVLRLSAWAARLLHEVQYRAEFDVCWLPDVDEAALTERLHELKRERGGALVAGAQSPFANIPARLWLRLCDAAGIFAEQRWAKLPKTDLLRLVDQLLRSRFTVHGKGEFKDEFVTAGGVSLDEVNFKTMESRVCPGLFFAGETLDIDGVTGGFNFQAAWTTSWIAGRAMASPLPRSS